MKKERAYLIVGAGLAGLCMAFHLRKHGKRVILLDNGHNSSSKVAAGVINPMVFRRMTKSWRADEFIPYATVFYGTLEKELEVRFLHEISIRRLFSSEQERGFWENKQHDPEYEAYLSPISSEDDSFSGAKNPFGSGRVKGAYHVFSREFITEAKAFLKKSGILLEEKFEQEQFDPHSKFYRTLHYEAVIFCEGPFVLKNPLFNHLPIQQTKGEIITIQCSNLKTQELLNRKCFVLPLGEGKFRVGATYAWNTMNELCTEEARNELTEKFRVLRDDEIEIIDQQAGARPTTPDRRPILGEHHTFKGIYIFNGLGTKGYMSAPQLASELCEHILFGKDLDKEVRIDRFKKC